MIHKIPNLPTAPSLVICGLAATAPVAGLADGPCTISSDLAFYTERLDQAIMLMQYSDIVVRAVDGKIRCQEEAAQSRQLCRVEGPGEMLVDAPRGQFVVQMSGAEDHILHVYASGDLSCGLAAELE